MHTTDAYFAYSKTAQRLHDPARRALVTSIHTDTPSYTRVYSEGIYRKLLLNGNGGGGVGIAGVTSRGRGGYRWTLGNYSTS